MTLAVAASLGLAGLLFRVPHAELGLKVLGSAYLVWLALGLARAGSPGAVELAQPRRFGTGVLLLWLNPKAWAMTLSAAAAFAGQAAGPLQLAVVLGIAFGLCATASQVAWCTLGGAVARVLQKPWQWRTLNLTLGVLVVASVVPIWL